MKFTSSILLISAAIAAVASAAPLLNIQDLKVQLGNSKPDGTPASADHGDSKMEGNLLKVNLASSTPADRSLVKLDLAYSKLVDGKLVKVDLANSKPVDGKLTKLDIGNSKPVDGKLVKLDVGNSKPVDVKADLRHSKPEDGTLLKVDLGHSKAAEGALLDVDLANDNGLLRVNTDIVKRCSDCTSKDEEALSLVVDASAKHYSKIAHVRLDNLWREIKGVKVTNGDKDLPKERAALTITIKTNIDKAKKDCSSEALAPIIKATVTSDPTLDIPWSKKEEAEKKLVDLDIKLTKVVLDHVHGIINAELLSKACAEKITNTEIAPTPAPDNVPEGPFVGESLPPKPETPAPVPENPAPVPEATTKQPAKNNGGLQIGIDIASDVDSKFVCKSGCKGTKDAESVLNLRVNIEKGLRPRLDQFYDKEMPTDCTEKRGELLGNVLSLLGVDVNAIVNV
ncbi:hypothetical protein BGX31_006934 [Mortierella sp. GBA43]|nr:hypothetical protein BGX31_006934 [Mortierella sp. GBA43]